MRSISAGWASGRYERQSLRRRLSAPLTRELALQLPRFAAHPRPSSSTPAAAAYPRVK